MKIKRLKNVNSLSYSHDICHQPSAAVNFTAPSLTLPWPERALTDILHYMLRDESSNARISQIQTKAHKSCVIFRAAQLL